MAFIDLLPSARALHFSKAIEVTWAGETMN